MEMGNGDESFGPSEENGRPALRCTGKSQKQKGTDKRDRQEGQTRMSVLRNLESHWKAGFGFLRLGLLIASSSALLKD